MKYFIRFKIGNRLGAKSSYSLREFCVSVVERYSLTNAEVGAVVRLQPDETFENEDLHIVRQHPTTAEIAEEQKREHAKATAP